MRSMQTWSTSVSSQEPNEILYHCILYQSLSDAASVPGSADQSLRPTSSRTQPESLSHTSLGRRCMTAYLLLTCPDLRWSRVTGGAGRREWRCRPIMLSTSSNSPKKPLSNASSGSSGMSSTDNARLTCSPSTVSLQQCSYTSYREAFLYSMPTAIWYI
jgi:hypothetical protein